MSQARRTDSDLVTLINPKPTWDILVMVGDDAGLASELAAKVRHATVIRTHPVSAHAAEGFSPNSLAGNLIFDGTYSGILPYAENCFDLVFCYRCSHMLPDCANWLQQTRRILKPRGLLALTTHLIPGTRLRGKKARALRESGDYINAWHRLRDSQHRRFYNQHQWEDILIESGYALESKETVDDFFDFDLWVNTARAANNDRLRLKAMLIQAPEKAREFLTPQFAGDRIRFRLLEITILATSQGNKD